MILIMRRKIDVEVSALLTEPRMQTIETDLFSYSAYWRPSKCTITCDFWYLARTKILIHTWLGGVLQPFSDQIVTRAYDPKTTLMSFGILGSIPIGVV